MNLRQFSVRTRLSWALGLLTAAFVSVTGFNAWQTHKQADIVFHLLEHNAVEMTDILNWQSAVAQNLIRTKVALQSTDAALVEQLNKDMKVTSARIDELQKTTGAFMGEGAERAAFEKVLAARRAYTDIRKEALAAKVAGDSEKAQALLTSKVNPAVDAYLAAVNEVLQTAQVASKELTDHARDSASSTFKLSLVVAAAVTLMAILLAWRISRSVTAPLTRAVQAVAQMAQGDLRVQVQDDSRDEPGVLLREIQKTAASMSEVLRGMQRSSESVMLASREIASGNQDLSARTESQASNLQQSAAAVEEMTATVQNNASVSGQASSMTREAAAASDEASRSVRSIEQTMLRIQEASAKVGDIVTIIDSIAFQTNLLALNASVEAARAGEQGRGFAVVASEVRSLAQRSAESAREIKRVVAQTLEQVEAGVRGVQATSATVTAARERVERVSALVAEIASATQQQAIGLDEINQAIGGLDSATQQNSALVEESAAAAHSLSEQAAQLSGLANRFQLA